MSDSQRGTEPLPDPSGRAGRSSGNDGGCRPTVDSSPADTAQASGGPEAAHSAGVADAAQAGDATDVPRPAEASSAARPDDSSSDPESDQATETPIVAGVGESPGRPVGDDSPSLIDQVKQVVIGKPRDLADRTLFSHVTLIAFLAWVGLGADGLSSSCYGPEEAFHHLEGHHHLAVFLAAAIIGTVLIISSCYSHLIEEFPSGGGGYLVASKLLGPRFGLVSGCALLIDYVLTIATSIAAAGNALFGLLGPSWTAAKLPTEFFLIVLLIVLNLRGVRESVQVLMPIFLVFLISHALLIFGVLGMHLPEAGSVATGVTDEIRASLADPAIGFFGMLALLMKAYSLGAGTYTGIEAVSNSMQVMREPRVATAKRTMLYMAISLATMAGGLILAYLLLRLETRPDKTLNQVLTETFLGEIGLGGSWLGSTLLWITLLSEGALLIVAAQAGFIGGPRGLANMAHDSWVPRWFASLSERLAAHYGILLLGGAAIVALLLTRGNISLLLVIYSINVFVTFTLSMFGMFRLWWQRRKRHPLARRRLALFGAGAVLCSMILCVTVVMKFADGAWVTILVTGCCVALCLAINRYYRRVGEKLRTLDEALRQIDTLGAPNTQKPDPNDPTAVILVGGYSGIGIHTLLNVIRFAPGYHKNFIFISAGTIDTGNFKGAEAVDDLKRHTEEHLRQYVDLARRLGFPSESYMTIGTDPVDDLEGLCRQVGQIYPHATFFAGQLVFQRDSWVQRLLHNQTAYSLQRRLQWIGLPMVILPTRVR